MLPWYTPVTDAALLISAAAESIGRVATRPMWPCGAGAWAGVSLRGVLVLTAAGATLYALSELRAPSHHASLAFPSRQGTLLVVNSGSIELLSAHLITLRDDRDHAFGGQSHGVHLVRAYALERRSTRLQQRDPAHRIFGSSVLASCMGHVVAMTDGLPDQQVPDVDRAHRAGNHVLRGCGAVQVRHRQLQRGSGGARAGDTVESGALPGRVGNSGDTGMPHLLVHTQHAGTAAMLFGGAPLPIQLGGWYPVRNNHLTEERR